MRKLIWILSACICVQSAHASVMFTILFTKSLARNSDRQLDDVMDRVAEVGSRASLMGLEQTSTTSEARAEVDQQA